ncbi:hypothetical protein BEWA_002410 [Theileria equi strain WA]|uniref:mRNA export factor GLE1 n=1 Tax=Theileria equi strain WA TaxID=1537102 RepID=L0B125_THEEQ|nr:hypothetical protein BEWA_002410 [Theileria equi strain WA]AFZ80834.1 hypothetical protein BEWA_002410 [Theileria equi strain WA]|eukprot:XP_004830500.1 hypothetical protein BEWA_002410 [Theileria equi strain WA]
MTIGVTFSFDESLFVEERKISVPGMVCANNDFKVDFPYNLPKIDNSQHISKSIARIALSTFEGRRCEVWEPENTLCLSRELSADNVEYIEDTSGYTTSMASVSDYMKPSCGSESSFQPERGYDVTHIKEMENRKESLHNSVDNILEGNKRISQDFYSKILDDTLNEIQSLEKEREERLAELERKREAKLKTEQKAAELAQTQTSNSMDKDDRKTNTSLAVGSGTKDTQNPSLMPSHHVNHSYSPQNIYTEKYDAYLEDYNSLKNIYDNVMNNMEYKPYRIAISRKVTTCINAVAGTTRQVDLSFSTISAILNECGHNDLKIYAIFRIVQNVFDMCEPGCQIYLNKKSVWPFAHLIRGLLTLSDYARVIYFSLLLKRSQYAIPRLFIGEDIETLCKHHEIKDLNSDSTFKHIQAFVRLHLSILVVLNDHTLLWSWFAGFINSCWSKVLKATLAAVLITALETCAFYLLGVYNKQFHKVLANCEELLQHELELPENKKFAPTEMYIGQLKMFFLDFRKSGKINEPDGYQMKHHEEELRMN